ncbi:hypothetical protein JTE90_011945 [Oedothorax gibbosus]|uniref:Uncharacterized protein n=1 Tax=Oedothorax gibbosus TaxID=931172 RepID=A0AAV6V2W7_9ARAC|nr:hypothetical protein JTE90_011945 [Oedothorax gibbosus]
MSRKISIPLLIYLFSVISISISCPRKEDLRPCHCEWPGLEGSAYILCHGLNNEQDLSNAASSLRGKNYVYSFTIDNSNFNFIPSDAFKGLNFVELDINATTLRALTDTDEAFVGLEDHLEILIMTDCVFMSEWDWSIFRNLKKLRTLDIVGSDLEIIGEELMKINITNVEDISFARNRISYIYDNAFVTFRNLRILSLNDNEIKEMKRTMFPNPALTLADFDISHNLIEQLPEDLFTNMPSLDTLSIGYNKILVLKENIFSGIWEQLDLFHTMGNELRCDCRMAWLLEQKFPRVTRGMCALPREVKGKTLDKLTSKDLWCYK